MIAKESRGFFGTSFLSSVSSSVNTLSKTIQSRSLPEINKRINELHQRARQLPTQIVNLQGQLENERRLFVQNKDSSEKNTRDMKTELIPPWVGFHGYEHQLKKAIKELSKDERNFLIPPPEDTHFQFDLVAYTHIAKATLHEDKQLSKMRFTLVPQQVSEPIFWRNYFYRVSMVKETIMSQPPEPGSEGVLFNYEDEEEDKIESDKNKDSDNDSSISIEPIPMNTPTVDKKDKDVVYEDMEDWEIELRRAAI